MFLWRFLDFFIRPQGPQNDPKKDKPQRISRFFKIFMQFLSIFQWISWMRMLKTFNKARTRSPIVFYEEIMAVFQMKKISK